MRLFECVEPLKVPCCDRQGKAVAGRDVTVPVGAYFMAEDGEDQEPVELRPMPSTRCPPLWLTKQTLKGHFRKMV